VDKDYVGRCRKLLAKEKQYLYKDLKNVFVKLLKEGVISKRHGRT
jgi:hypothetical protein